MSTTKRRYTLKDIILGQTIPFILLTIVLAFILNNYANKGLNAYLNMNNDHPLYTPVYSFGKLGIVFIIPAAMISLFALKLFFIAIRKQSSSATIDSTDQKGRIFRWYALYGAGLGVLMYRFSFMYLIDYVGSVGSNDVIQAILMVVTTFGGLAIMVYVVRFINESMVKHTKTNVEILDDIDKGLHDSIFTKNIEKDRVIRFLQRGWTTNLKVAMFYAFIQQQIVRFIRFIIKLYLKYIGWIFKQLLQGLFSGDSYHYGGSGDGGGSARNPAKDAYELQKEKDTAHWDVKQKERQAAYSAKHAVKRINYNAYHAGNKAHQAVRNIDKAEEARRDYNDKYR